jgi:hypothetical protein
MEQLMLFFKETLEVPPVITPKRMGFQFPAKSETKGTLMVLKLEIQE